MDRWSTDVKDNDIILQDTVTVYTCHKTLSIQNKEQTIMQSHEL